MRSMPIREEMTRVAGMMPVVGMTLVVVMMPVVGMMAEEMMQGAVMTVSPATATLGQIGPRTAATETATATQEEMTEVEGTMEVISRRLN
jgi:hypothetical protein